MKNKAFAFYTGVFMISGLVMMLQILQSRLFSVTSWYHLSFLVISMAMFGLTMGALKIYRSDEEEQRKNYGAIARNHCIWFGLFVLVGLVSQLFIPIVSNDMTKTLASLPIAAAATAIAYYHAGVAITVSLTRAPFPVGRTYGIDLLGAGLGCIAALGLMETIDAPSAILIVSGLGFFSALLFPVSEEDTGTFRLGHKTHKVSTFALGLCVLITSLGVFNASRDTPLLYPLWIKNRMVPMSSIAYEEWNSISRVTVSHDLNNITPFLWGPSNKLPEHYRSNGKFLVIDGDAGTLITDIGGGVSEHGYLEYDVTNIAYTMPNIKNVAIIGVGGGRDLLSAKYFGAENVTALDVNPVQTKILTEYEAFKDYAGLYNQPGVKILNEEARSWFRRNTDKLDLIQMSLIDTWAATGAGAFALSENGLYTVEAWTIFMNDLSDHGVFTLSRWSSNVMDDAGRSLSVAMAALFNQGVSNVRDHIAIFSTKNEDTLDRGNIATLVVSKSPFTQEQLDALENTAREKDYLITVMPNKPAPTGILGELIVARDLKDLLAISDKQFYDVSPSTDMRPFFFNQARLTRPLEVAALALKPLSEGHFVSMGQAKATFNLYIIILFSLAMVVFVIVAPLLKTVENKCSRIVVAGSLYFMLIGLGFMFIEISLLQALGVFLGHPIYGLSVVLFSLIIAAGLGSLLSEKIPLRTLPRQLIWCALTCAYGIGMSMYLSDIFYQYAEADIVNRVLISIAIMSPAGLLMGFGFPTGLYLTERFDRRATAWFWGINGAAGVLGSSIAIACNIALGIDQTLIIGGVCYALLSISFLLLCKPPKSA